MNTIDIVREKMPHEIFRRALLSRMRNYRVKEEVLPFLLCTYLLHEELDTVCVVFLSSKMKIISVRFMRDNTFSIFDIIERECELHNVAYFALAHTHGTYPTTPSYEDRATTNKLRRFYTENPKYLDHYIVAGYEYRSMEKKSHEYIVTNK